jgi:hypothetical protein
MEGVTWYLHVLPASINHSELFVLLLPLLRCRQYRRYFISPANSAKLIASIN